MKNSFKVMDLLALSNSAANFLLYFAMSSQVTIWLSPITFDLFSLFLLGLVGMLIPKANGPPPLPPSFAYSISDPYPIVNKACKEFVMAIKKDFFRGIDSSTC